MNTAWIRPLLSPAAVLLLGAVLPSLVAANGVAASSPPEIVVATTRGDRDSGTSVRVTVSAAADSRGAQRLVGSTPLARAAPRR
jgi:hypothetical protein